MAEQEPARGQPAKPRRPRRESATSKPPANEAHSTPTAANGQGRPATGPLYEGEGIFDPRGNSPEGLFEPLQQVRAQQQPAAAGSTPPPLGHPKFVGRTIHLNTARFIIASGSLVILAFVVIMSFVIVGWRSNVPVDNLMRLLEVLFAPLVALVGIAVAFYYHGNSP
jgi:hypothetical protein